MKPSEQDPHPESETRGAEHSEFTLANSKALAPLLLLFGLTVLIVLLTILRAEPIVSPVGAPATRAFGPADFPNVFAGIEPLAGLEDAGGRAEQLTFPVPAPPFSEDIYPCSECHNADMPADPERRELGMHEDIVFTHDAEHRWCLDCHDEKDRDQLRLANGTLVPFTQSYRLCGQCHGTQFRDWRTGIHGKRTGYWNGAKRYLLCVHCHNPHSPRFAALKPLPPPVRPQYLRPHAQDRPAAVAALPAHGGGKGSTSGPTR